MKRLFFLHFEPGVGPRARRGIGKLPILLGVALATVVGVVAYGVFARPDPKLLDRPLTKVVSRGPFEHVVSEQGEIESSSNVEIRCDVKARGTSGITIISVVPEGSVVAQGEELVKLDSTALDQERIQQLIATNTAEAMSIQSKNTYEAAQIAKIEYLEGTFKQDELLILSEVFVAEQSLRQSELAFKSAERLGLRGMVTALQLEGEQFAVDKARKDLEAATTKLNVLRKYTKEKTLKQLDSDITSAEAKWSADQKSYELETTKLRDIEDQISKCTILAPRAGQVVYANKFSQGRGGSNAEFVVEPGAIVREQQPIIRLPDPSEMQVKATISEARINLVRPGMPVAIRVDALREDVLEGEVTKVSQYAEPGGWSSGNVKKYATFVKIKSPPPELRAGMNAEVRIYVERQPSALQIPVQAIAEQDNRFYVLVENANLGLEMKEITRGPSNDKFMVVLDGLNVGDQVVLDPRSRSELNLPNTNNSNPVAATVTPPPGTAVAMPSGPNASGENAPGEAEGPPRGGFTPANIVSRIFEEFDIDKDSKLSADELAQMPEERRGRMPSDADANSDGAIDRLELTSAFTKVFAQRSASGSGPPGPPSGGGQ